MRHLSSIRLWLYALVARVLPETRGFALKVFLLRRCGASVGRNVRINSSAVFSGTGSLAIGDDVWVGPKCFISPVGVSGIRIGNHVDLGPQVMILTGTHRIEPEGEHIGGAGTSASVSVGNGCWLGARSTLLPGVALADKTVVAAGAVVTASVTETKTLVAGVPARVKKRFKPASCGEG